MKAASATIAIAAIALLISPVTSLAQIVYFRRKNWL